MDFVNETPIRTSTIAERFGVDVCSVVRWITRGVVIRGKRVKLSARRIGGKWLTTESAWSAFVTATNPETAEAVPDAIPSQAEHKKRVEEATKELRRRGVKC